MRQLVYCVISNKQYGKAIDIAAMIHSVQLVGLWRITKVHSHGNLHKFMRIFRFRCWTIHWGIQLFIHRTWMVLKCSATVNQLGISTIAETGWGDVEKKHVIFTHIFDDVTLWLVAFLILSALFRFNLFHYAFWGCFSSEPNADHRGCHSSS